MKGAPYHRGVCLCLRPGIEPGPSVLKAGTRPIKVTHTNRRVLDARQQEVSASLNFAQMCLNK